MSLQRKKWLLVVLMITLMIPILGVVAQDSDVKVAWPDLGGKEITIAVENAYPPYNYYPPDSKVAVGWDYDTFTAICQLLNCVPKFEETAWDGMLLGIANGQYDVAADGITYTAERDKTVDFSQLYQAYDETLLIRDNDTRFTTAAELKKLDNFMVGTQIGTTNEITAKALFGEDRVKSFDQFGPAIQALKNDDVDAVVVDRPAAEGYIEAQGGLKTLPESLNGIEGLAFAFPPGSKLVNPVNAAMSAMQASGAWDEIYAKWFKTTK